MQVELKKAIKLRKRLFKIWKDIDEDMLTKFNNLTGKTAMYDVPEELFQKRTSRKNRVLLPYKQYKNNKIKYHMLDTFEGGVCVELVNYDLIDEENQNNEDFIKIKNKIGSDEKISAIVTFRTEDGDSGANQARESYKAVMKMIEDGKLELILDPIKRKEDVEYKGRGDNSVWDGNCFVSIKGGQQTGVETHEEIGEQKLFNPAIDYANPQVCEDLNIAMSYYAMHCFDINKKSISGFDKLKEDVEDYLKDRLYETGNLLELCRNNPTLKYGDGNLIDPLQFKKISIKNFSSKVEKENSMVICHNEAANKETYYYDRIQEFILTPARPDNLFWATHLSNMMQQNYTLEEYYEEEDKRYKKRKEIILK